MKRIVLFASGSGSNVENIIQYFSENTQVEIVAVLTNRKDAKVLDRCARLNISALYFNRHAFVESNLISDFLNNLNLDLIVLAGFLWRIPKRLIDYFPDVVASSWSITTALSICYSLIKKTEKQVGFEHLYNLLQLLFHMGVNWFGMTRFRLQRPISLSSLISQPIQLLIRKLILQIMIKDFKRA